MKARRWFNLALRVLCLMFLVGLPVQAQPLPLPDEQPESTLPPPVVVTAIEWNAPTVDKSVTPEALLIPPPPPWRKMMREDFEGPFPSTDWRIFDSNGVTNGEYYWDDDDYKALLDGSHSAWAADAGANGLDPAASNYPNNARSWMIYGPFSLSNYSDAYLSFYYWLESESANDYMQWMASIDGSHFYGYVTSGVSSGWQSVTFDLGSVPTLGTLADRPQVWIAFTFYSDSSITYKGAFVDDIELWGYYTGGDIYLPLVLRNFSASPTAPRYPVDYYSTDWELATVQAPQAWGYSTGDGMVIAIIDSGVNFSDPELDAPGKAWTNPGEIAGNNLDDDDNNDYGYSFRDDMHGWNFFDNNNDPNDYAANGHGTSVALNAARETNEDPNTYAAIGWNAQIMALKIGNASGIDAGLMDDAVRYARKNGAHVINMSVHWAGACPSSLQDEIARAYDEGILVVVAGNGDGYYPSNCNDVIGVAATNQSDNVISGGAGTKIDVAAPGTATSWSAPMVSGLAALLKARHPGYNADQLADAILCNADDRGTPGRDNSYGYGRINAYNALRNGAVGCGASWK